MVSVLRTKSTKSPRWRMTHYSRLLPQDKIAEHRQRALNPEHPVIRGTSANPDTYFQSREATNPWYDAV